MHVGTLILGAGPTGLGAATRLAELGDADWLLLDAAPGPGGMAASQRDEMGFTWDLGGHVIHSHYPAFDRALELVADWSHPRRGGWVYLPGGWVPTPIQQNLGLLRQGPTILAEIGGDAADATNLHEWFLATFGPTLCGVFFVPYNTKQWAHPPEMLGHQWTSLRGGSKAPNVPPPLRCLGASAQPADRSPFPYPTHGTGAVWDTVAARLPASRQEYGVSVVQVDLGRRRATLADGRTIGFDHCVSSIPLTKLLRMLSDRPDLAALAGGLRHASIHALGFGFEGEMPAALRDKTWVMCPDPAVPFHRATLLSAFSPAMAGPGRWSILCEVAVSPHRRVSADGLAARCLAAMAPWGVRSAPISAWSRYLELGTPVPFLGRDALLSRILDALDASGVLSRGRFGGWRYESSNQDYAYMQGIEAVQAIRAGDPEAAFWPDRPRARVVPTTGEAAPVPVQAMADAAIVPVQAVEPAAPVA